MSTLVIVEHDNFKVHSGTVNTLTAALQLQREVILFVIGYQCQSVAAEAAKLPGVSAVWVADHLDYAHPLAENLSELIVSLSASFSAILAPASTFGKNLLPRIAAKLDVTQVSDVSKILNEDTFEHPIYAGNAIETVRVFDVIKVLSIRTTAFDAENRSQLSCPIETIDKKMEWTDTKFIKHELSESKRPELGNAKVVVAGGRGLQNADNFKLIEALADALGGAVGASRAAVDAGYVSNDYQVGQTGKVVAPALYFAVGISGAIQHIAGMKDAKIIVAINKDPEAPIFQIATYGLVGDLFEVLPQLIEALNKENLIVI